MEAYQAYYNTNSAGSGTAGDIKSGNKHSASPEKAPTAPSGISKPRETSKPDTQKEKGGEKMKADGKEAGNGNTNIINNIMHINHSGTNINIMSAPNCQNNFIFNHTAPINLNFYKNNKAGAKNKPGAANSKQPLGVKAITDSAKDADNVEGGSSLTDFDIELV